MGTDSDREQVAGREKQCPTCGSPSSGVGVLRGDVVIGAVLPRSISAALQLVESLTNRERVTFELLGLGYDNRTIARALEISERTVKRHVTAILNKLALESRLQVGLVALLTSTAASAAGDAPRGIVPGGTVRAS